MAEKERKMALGGLRCGGHLPQAAQIGQQHRQCNENTDQIGGGGGPGYTVDTNEMIKQRHQQNIGGSLAYQRKQNRLGPLACGLEHRNGKEDEGAGGAGKADDLQEGAPWDTVSASLMKQRVTGEAPKYSSTVMSSETARQPISRP